MANEDGDITLYDTTKQGEGSRVKCNYVCVNDLSTVMFSALKTILIYCIMFLFIAFVAHHNAVFDICWLPDKCQIISGSGDHNAALWDISCTKLISVFNKHSASIKSVDVCPVQSGML